MVGVGWWIEFFIIKWKKIKNIFSSWYGKRFWTDSGFLCVRWKWILCESKDCTCNCFVLLSKFSAQELTVLVVALYCPFLHRSTSWLPSISIKRCVVRVHKRVRLVGPTIIIVLFSFFLLSSFSLLKFPNCGQLPSMQL